VPAPFSTAAEESSRSRDGGNNQNLILLVVGMLYLVHQVLMEVANFQNRQ